jgi:hypothetical protein
VTSPSAVLDGLTQLDRDVLRVLSEAHVTTSVMTLAADLWRTSPDWLADDLTPLLAFLLEGLSTRGLVRYVLAPVRGGGAMPDANDANDTEAEPMPPSLHEQPVGIRLTPLGWEAMGYPRVTTEVGTPARHYGDHRHGDRTDYRNHGYQAEGGSVEKDDFLTHRLRYPHHIHPLMEDIPMTTEQGRTYLKVTGEMEARVLAYRERLGTTSYADIAEAADLPERTIKYILTDLPRLRRVNDGEFATKGSLRERILWLLEEIDVKSAAELRRILGMADTPHDVVHVLHGLRQQGKVTFDERVKGEPTNISLTRGGNKLGRKGGGFTVQAVADAELDAVEKTEGAHTVKPKPGTNGVEPFVAQRVHESVADEVPVQPTPEAAFAAVETYPLLDELRVREVERRERDAKAMAYVAAAEAVKDVDRVMHDDLMAKADAFNVAFPSPIESEYLRFAEAHRDE